MFGDSGVVSGRNIESVVTGWDGSLGRNRSVLLVKCSLSWVIGIG